MRAPDPEKWKATETMVNGLSYDVPGDINVASVVSLCNAISRRRALEELRALFPQTYSPVVDQHYGGPAPRLLDFDVILSRIAEIEAEGE